MILFRIAIVLINYEFEIYCKWAFKRDILGLTFLTKDAFCLFPFNKHGDENGF